MPGGPKPLQTGDRIIEMDERLVGVQGLVVKHGSGAGHVIGGLGAELPEARCRFVGYSAFIGAFWRHGCSPSGRGPSRAPSLWFSRRRG